MHTLVPLPTSAQWTCLGCLAPPNYVTASWVLSVIRDLLIIFVALVGVLLIVFIFYCLPFRWILYRIQFISKRYLLTALLFYDIDKYIFLYKNKNSICKLLRLLLTLYTLKTSLFVIPGIDFKIKTVELRGKKIKLQIW